MTGIQTTKFQNPDWTLGGDIRARVKLEALKTLWFNTGSLCNVACRNCYIESSPSNDALAYISAEEVAAFLDEIDQDHLLTTEIGFTGGEPFLNPAFLTMLGDALARGHKVLVLTNAMRPMMRPRIRDGLLALLRHYGERLTLRVSLDHYTQALHETERGPQTWQPALDGISWLVSNRFQLSLAGRLCWGESEAETREGFRNLIDQYAWPLDAFNPAHLVLFPEMDVDTDVPEISTKCWDILHKKPEDVMCASSRMIVKRKDGVTPVVLPCTLLPYDTRFEMGATLRAAKQADGGLFDQGAVKLAHPHCAKFCVLGGATCS